MSAVALSPYCYVSFVRCYFLEDGVVDSDGRLLREKQKAINKIGHG